MPPCTALELISSHAPLLMHLANPGYTNLDAYNYETVFSPAIFHLSSLPLHQEETWQLIFILVRLCYQGTSPRFQSPSWRDGGREEAPKAQKGKENRKSQEVKLRRPSRLLKLTGFAAQAGKTAQAEYRCVPENLSLSPRIYRMEGENQLPQVVL